MREYDLYFPLCYNDGRPVAEALVDRFKAQLVQQFGGLTYFPQENEGVWKFGGTTFRDRVVIFRVLEADPVKAREFFATLRPKLQFELAQANILIVERSVEVVE